MIFLYHLVGLVLSPSKIIGFPSVHPISAKCIGYKYKKTDKLGIPGVYCYGIMYDYWLE